MKLYQLILSLLLVCTACGTGSNKNAELAKAISEDKSLHVVDSMARNLIAQGLNAGSGYSQVWARDMNTFIETACEEKPAEELKQAILLFFALQQPGGEMIDGYVLKEDFTWYDNHPYYSDAAPKHVAFKNTVETDQETSLIQIVGKYMEKTGDKTILDEVVAGRSVYDRIKDMTGYLMTERYDSIHGLLYGAMTADWGDVQPGEGFACDMNEFSSRCIDVYDNAMFIIALGYMEKFAKTEEDRACWAKMKADFSENTRKHLWDSERRKFIPHIYLDKSPVPEGFDENEVYYHGGTAVAIEAGLLSAEEVAEANSRMLENVKKSGMPTIGLTLYPPYPDGFFSGGMASAYVYQNGGDWTWFGGRMIQQLVKYGMVEEAYAEIRPMIDRVVKNGDFYEWYGMGNVPGGSAHFKGSAGVLAKAIEMLHDWADSELQKNK